jgi:hypothetical protein
MCCAPSVDWHLTFSTTRVEDATFTSQRVPLLAFYGTRIDVVEINPAVILGAFVGDGSPSHLRSRGAFEAVRRVLKPGRGLVIRTFLASPRSPQTALHEPNRVRVHPEAVSDPKSSCARSWQPDRTRGIVLTDDCNPAEHYDAANREKLHRAPAMLSVAGQREDV